MRVTVWGGVNEYGRICFYLEANHAHYLLDCGIMRGNDLSDEERLPLIDPVLVPRIAGIFITHAHEDHTGGLPVMFQMGFSGKLFGTAETRQRLAELNLLPSGVLDSHWHELSASGLLVLENGLQVEWGPNGHLPGSVWYCLKTLNGHPSEDCRIYYSGDCSMDSLLYRYQPTLCRRMDLAIIDAAYQNSSSHSQHLAHLTRMIDERLAVGGRVLLPLPVDGRGPELLAYLAWHTRHQHIPFLVEAPLMIAMVELDHQRRWLHEKGHHLLDTYQDTIISGRIQGFNGTVPILHDGRPMLMFISESMMETESAQALYEVMARKDLVLLTGNQARNTFGAELLERQVSPSDCPRTVFIRYPVHLDTDQAITLSRQLEAMRVLLFHRKKDLSHEHISNPDQLLPLDAGESVRLP